jgi:hypothetical protein
LAIPAGSADLALSADEVAAQRDRLAALGFDLMLERQKRLTRVSSEIRYHGAALCPRKQSRVLGIVAATWGALPRAFRETAFQRYGVDDLVRVLWVLPGYPAADAGVLAGDTILQVDGHETHSAHFDEPSAQDLPDVTTLKIERDGEIFDLQLETRKGCFRPAEIVVLDTIDTQSEESRIIVYSGMLRFLPSDDELAVILGYELAQGLLGQPAGTTLGETEADDLGLYLAARAGYDVSIAPDLIRRLAREFPLALEKRAWHGRRSPAERAAALESAAREIALKLERGERLEPRGL